MTSIALVTVLRAAGRAGVAVCLWGDPGIGKSALIAAVASADDVPWCVQHDEKARGCTMGLGDRDSESIHFFADATGGVSHGVASFGADD